MSAFTSYATASTIDGTLDTFLKWESSTGVLKQINRSTIMGVTGQPADISTSQTLTNKVIGITNTITQKDGSFTLQNTADNTKQALFSLSGITTGTTRTYALPNVSDTLVSLTATQTLTNKTITSPTITGGTIDTTTITVDSITGHTTANTGSIYGLSITGGLIGGTSITNGSITNTQIATNGVSAANLATNAISLSTVTQIAVQTGITNSAVLATGLTTTVTIPSGGRKIRVEAYISGIASTAATNVIISIYNSATVTGSAIQQGNIYMPTLGTANALYTFWEGTPAPGSQSYCVALAVGSGTANTSSSATNISYLTVKVI